MSDVVEVSLRGHEEEGTRACRRLRRSGMIPAVLYGHKESVVNIKVCPDQVMAAIKAGHKLVDLKGEVSESALVKKVQWDALGSNIIHVDFTRVSATEKVRTRVAVELRGDAPGVKAGGILTFITHDMDIEAAASAIPEKIVVSVKELQLEGEIFAKEVPLPAGVTLAGHGDDVIVACHKPKAAVDEVTVPGGAAEPELIRKEKPADADDE